jgi:Ni,Fe-hydrogenase III large subunit
VVAGGIPARAAGFDWDARAADEWPPRAATLEAADAASRLWLMLAECDDALRLLKLALDDLPAGGLSAPLPDMAGAGFALVEGARGPALCWLRLDEGGLIAQAWLHDPSWGHLPMLEAALAGAELHDVTAIRASIPISASGMDL